jgi:hypothetical protein
MFRLAKGVYIPSFTAENRPNADQIVGLALVDGVLNLSDGSTWSIAGGGGGGAIDPIELTVSRDIVATDNGGRLLNKTVTNITVTLLADDAANEFTLEQESSGTITVVGDIGVTVNGAVLDTTLAGDFLLVERTGTNEYRVRAGGA